MVNVIRTFGSAWSLETKRSLPISCVTVPMIFASFISIVLSAATDDKPTADTVAVFVREVLPFAIESILLDVT